MWVRAIVVGISDRLSEAPWIELILREAALYRMAAARRMEIRGLAWDMAMLASGGLKKHRFRDSYVRGASRKKLTPRELVARKRQHDRILADAESALGAKITRASDISKEELRKSLRKAPKRKLGKVA